MSRCRNTVAGSRGGSSVVVVVNTHHYGDGSCIMISLPNDSRYTYVHAYIQ